MKLVLAGSTGLIGTEVIRQSLLNPRVTRVIALTRRPIDVQAIAATTEAGEKDVDTSKVKSVILQDFTKYPEEVKRELADADACIWALALTPMRSRSYPWDEVVRVIKDYCVVGMKTLLEARRTHEINKPFRFMYISGRAVSRDLTKKPWIMGDMLLLRGEVENTVLAFAEEQKASGWQVCIAKPGLVSGLPGAFGIAKNAAIAAIGRVGHTVSKEDCVAAMLQQCADGFDSDTLENPTLVNLGRKART